MVSQVKISSGNAHPWPAENHLVAPLERGADGQRIILPVVRNRTKLFYRTPPPPAEGAPSRGKSNAADLLP